MMSRWRRTGPLILVCLLTLLGPANAHADAVATIVSVMSRDAAPYREALKGFEDVLKHMGREARIHRLSMDTFRGDEQALVRKVRDRRPDLILTIGSTATEAVSRAVKDIPIVFSLVLPLSGNGLPAAPDTAPGNMTGATMEIPYETQFSRIRDVLPSARRIGVLYDPRLTGPIVEAAADAARAVGLHLAAEPVSSERDIMDAIAALDGQIDVLWSVADGTVFSQQGLKEILLSTLRNRIPFVGLSPSFVKARALLALSVDCEDIGRQSGEAALRILGGEHPSRLAVTAPRIVSLFLNMNTARQIRLEIQDEVKRDAELVF